MNRRRLPVRNVLDAINGNESDIDGYVSSSGDEDDECIAQLPQQQVRISGKRYAIFIFILFGKETFNLNFANIVLIGCRE